MVLLDTFLNGLPSLPIADLPTLAWDAVPARCFQAKVVLDGGNWQCSYAGGLTFDVY